MLKSTLKYIVQRIALMLFTLLIITFICFVLIRMLPPVELPAGDPHSAIIEAQREAKGYNKPYLVQFGIFLRDVFTRFDWGLSDYLFRGQSVVAVFGEKLPATIIINLFSIILSIPIGIALGIFAALKKNTWIDHTISTVTMVSISVPSFVYAFLIQYFLSFKLGWFPFLFGTNIHSEPLVGSSYLTGAYIYSMLPAVLALSFGVIAGFTRTTRAELTEVLTNEYMLLARTKGLTKAQATVRHAFRNCMVVVVPGIFGEFIGIMSGSLIIEKIFSVPGIGGLYLNSINARDYPLFMMLTVFYTVVGLLAAIVVDISYSFIDPRIRVGSKK